MSKVARPAPVTRATLGRQERPWFRVRRSQAWLRCRGWVTGLALLLLWTASCQREEPILPQQPEPDDPSTFPAHVTRNLSLTGPFEHTFVVSLPSRLAYGTSMHPVGYDENGERMTSKFMSHLGWRQLRGRWIAPDADFVPSRIHQEVVLYVDLQFGLSGGSLVLLDWWVRVYATWLCQGHGRVSPTRKEEIGSRLERWLEDFTVVATQDGRRWSFAHPALIAEGTWDQATASAPRPEPQSETANRGREPAVVSFQFRRSWNPYFPYPPPEPTPEPYRLALRSETSSGFADVLDLTTELLSILRLSTAMDNPMKPCGTFVDDFVLSLARAAKSEAQ